jgi:hypothetical protein
MLEKMMTKKTLSQYAFWHEWIDVSEVEMWTFLGPVVSMGVILLPDRKDYWSQDFSVKFSHENNCSKCSGIYI